MLCPRCEEKIPDESLRCPYCATDLSHFAVTDEFDALLNYDSLLHEERRSPLPLILAIVGGIAVVALILFLVSRSGGEDVRGKLEKLTLPAVSDTAAIVVTAPGKETTETTAAQETAATLPSSTSEQGAGNPSVATFNAPTLPLYTQAAATPSPVPQPVATAPEEVLSSAGGTTYKVEKGDSWWSVCEIHYGTANFALAEKVATANGRTTKDELKIGETITVPALEGSVSVDSAGGEGELHDVSHTVVAGDSYWSLAEQYYGQGSIDRAEKIAAANNRPTTVGLRTGEVIRIPDVEGPAQGPPGSRSYVVQAGDSWWSVCEKFYDTANFTLAGNLAEVNGRTIDDGLKEGETIIVPPR